ncbi:MAG: nitroreductase family protein [Pseudomonadota bacterium]
MKQPVTTVIDRELCTGCGLCIAVCPSGTLSLVDGKARVTGDRSLGCGHCQAVCPTGAARVEGLEEPAFASFSPDRSWLPPGQGDPAQLARLMLSRRSCRNFQERPLSRQVLADLVSFGQAAPSGTNSQLWTFTILAQRSAVLELGQEVGAFFADLNRLAARAWLAQGLKLLGRPQLADYHRDHHDSVAKALEEFKASGRERLFHGAPAAILVGSLPGGSCPAEDALLASQNILLAAHVLGLGSCLVGFVVEALRRRPAIKARLGLGPQETVHAAIALGYPAERYARQAGRRPLAPRWL